MSQSLRIVIADDEPEMRRYFEKCLPRLGHQLVGAAENGRDLVELCRRLTPDLIITDVRMPEMIGTEAAAQLQQERRVPVILVSAYDDLGPDGSNGGWALRLVKPIRQADLQRAILQAMGKTMDQAGPEAGSSPVNE